MTALRVPRKFTPEEYLRFEEHAEYKSEFYNGEIFAMAGASPKHNVVFTNVFGWLCRELEGKKCQPIGSDQRLRVLASGLYTYPDIQIVCQRPSYDPRSPSTLINPTVIFEIISDSTEEYDCGVKLDFYRDVESAKGIVHIWQDEVRVEVYHRTPDGQWGKLRYHDSNAEIPIPGIALNLPMSRVYLEPQYGEAE